MHPVVICERHQLSYFIKLERSYNLQTVIDSRTYWNNFGIAVIVYSDELEITILVMTLGYRRAL